MHYRLIKFLLIAMSIIIISNYFIPVNTTYYFDMPPIMQSILILIEFIKQIFVNITILFFILFSLIVMLYIVVNDIINC